MKFKVGEIVILVARRKPSPIEIGSEVTITHVGPFPPGGYCPGRISPMTDSGDYFIEYFGEYFYVQEWQLRKRPERGIPKEVREIFEQSINVGMVTT